MISWELGIINLDHPVKAPRTNAMGMGRGGRQAVTVRTQKCLFCFLYLPRRNSPYFYSHNTFFWKRKTLYIEVIPHLENFPISAERAHNLQKFDKNPDTLMIVNSKTRPPLMCPGKKKILDHLCQKNETHWSSARHGVMRLLSHWIWNTTHRSISGWAVAVSGAHGPLEEAAELVSGVNRR